MFSTDHQASPYFSWGQIYFCHHIKTMQSNNIGGKSTLISVKV